ncbi:MAG TPA: hypothetical protein VFV31_10670 [Chitinophagaceae bacterium]|nr:hypothetical protein [Chitinophagaceae bacterium]
MKRTFILTLTALVVFAITITGCKSSRVWETKEKSERTSRRSESPPPAPYYNRTALIISPSPGFTMNRFHDGRYFHRSPAGLLYWKGYDNRFFLDGSYLGRVSYSRWEYDEWRRFKRASESGRRRN